MQNLTVENEFSWGSFLGVAKLWVDGNLVLKSRPLALQDLSQAARLCTVSGSAGYLAGLANGSGLPNLTTGWTIEVGQRERHVVRIEKERPRILAAFRANTYRVFVDGEYVKEYVG